MTRWGRELDPTRPLPEHPRPQLVRDGWHVLNGVWEHAFTATPEPPRRWDGPIVVPFSPEAPLSGVGRQLQPDEWLWYRRTLIVPVAPAGGRHLLHLGAVDQTCRVRVGGTTVGGHTGGYLPFTLDVTEAVAAAGGDGTEVELLVRVRDLSETGVHARGKQRLDRGEIWYTAQSGIWQTVWWETVPATYVERLELVPGRDHLRVTVHAAGGASEQPAHVVVRAEGREVAAAEVVPGRPTDLPLPGARRWSPEDPFLHDLEVSLGEDRVTSYAGLRELGVARDDRGVLRLLLDGRVRQDVGVLDQGYWPDGLLTPPSDEAVVADLRAVRDLGFTAIRKHVKVEPLRWYHHCDRLGIIVWQDVVNGGGRYRDLVTRRPARHPVLLPDRWHRLYRRGDSAGRAELRREVRETVALLAGTACVAVWTPFNEGWGQFDANAVAREVARLDPTRPVNAVSGWVDQGGGDVRSHHAYLRPFRMTRVPARLRRRLVALTEHGGASLRVEGHDWSEREHGYVHVEDGAALTRWFEDLHEPLVEAARAGLVATFYTQLTDVEDELNGLFTWDREVLKPDPEVVRRVAARLRDAGAPAATGR